MTREEIITKQKERQKEKLLKRQKEFSIKNKIEKQKQEEADKNFIKNSMTGKIKEVGELPLYKMRKADIITEPMCNYGYTLNQAWQTKAYGMKKLLRSLRREKAERAFQNSDQ